MPLIALSYVTLRQISLFSSLMILGLSARLNENIYNIFFNLSNLIVVPIQKVYLEQFFQYIFIASDFVPSIRLFHHFFQVIN